MDKEIVKKYIKGRKPVGLVVGLLNRNNNQIIKVGEVEKESQVPLAEDTIFEIGSVSKTFTSVLLGKFQNQGLLNLNDSITKFLPELRNNITLERITLFDLATHTSGLSNHPFRITLDSVATMYFPMKGTPHGAWSRFTKSNLFDYASRMNIKNSPNNWSYSNSGYGLIGHALENLLNQFWI